MSIDRKQEKLEEDNRKRMNKTENEDKHKYGPRTLSKPRGWMHQGLDGSTYHLMDLEAPQWRGKVPRLQRT